MLICFRVGISRQKVGKKKEIPRPKGNVLSKREIQTGRQTQKKKPK